MNGMSVQELRQSLREKGLNSRGSRKQLVQVSSAHDHRHGLPNLALFASRLHLLRLSVARSR